MSNSNTIYKNLVFEGGGVKGSAFAGSVQVLHEHRLLKNIEHVAATSAGAITATLLAVGAGSKGLTESVLDSNFNQFIYDPGWILMDIYRLFRHYGIHSGNSFAKILQGYIKQYAGDPNLTFEQLEQKVIADPHIFKHLSVVASNITTQKVDVFNNKNTPDLPIWKAVRCSMSIPVVFEPYEIKDNYYVDGGLGWLYPIDIYDEKKPDGEDIINHETLGFYLEPQNEINHPRFSPQKAKINSIKTAAEAIFNFLETNSNSKHIHPGDKSRTVFIDDLGISATDFSISKDGIKSLIKSGRTATEAFLK
jgi:NTE family protein